MRLARPAGRHSGAGAEVLAEPFDIATGRCAIVRDPFGNNLVLLDRSKGCIVTEPDGKVTGIARQPERHD